MGHISFWLMLEMCIYLEITYNTINKNRETLTDASKEFHLEINIEKTKLCCCLDTRMLVKLLFFQVVPHLFSQMLSGPRSRPTATQKIR
jgi:hypothetical protein